MPTEMTNPRPRGRPRKHPPKPYWPDELETASLAQDPHMFVQQAFDAGIVNAGEKQLWESVIQNGTNAE